MLSSVFVAYAFTLKNYNVLRVKYLILYQMGLIITKINYTNRNIIIASINY